MDENRIITNDLRIDKLALDDEAEKIASLYHYWSSMLAEAELKENQAKNIWIEKIAVKSLYFRSNPPEGVKITESVIESLVTTDKEVIALRQAYEQATYEAAKLRGDVKALAIKASSITDLRHLAISGYFIVPTRIHPDKAGDAVRSGLNSKLGE